MNTLSKSVNPKDTCQRKTEIPDTKLYTGNNEKYTSPYPGQFPIIASSALPDSITQKEEYVKNLADCYFNVGMFQSSPAAIKNALAKINQIKSEEIDKPTTGDSNSSSPEKGDKFKMDTMTL